jgi:hydroxymethylbilane synthase
VTVQYRWITSAGDRHQQAMAGQSPTALGKGQFTGAIEQAVLQQEADLAVHSLKDMPGEETKGLTLAAIPRREQVHDCLISRAGVASLAGLPEGAVFGTSSPRRAAQVRRLRGDLLIRTIRGNVQTRLSKVFGTSEPAAGPQQPSAPAETGSATTPSFDATLLAFAGLARSGLREYTTHALATTEMLPAACQGALALQCRADDHTTLSRCLPLNDPEAATAVHAERQVVAALGADCHSPVAVLARPMPAPVEARRNEGQWFHIHARVLSPQGLHLAEAEERAPTKRLRHRVEALITTLKQQGAERILAAARENPLPMQDS